MTSKCGKCGGFMWEIVQEEPSGSSFKLNFVRCTLCKNPVGVLEYYNLASKIEALEKLVKDIESRNNSLLGTIDYNIRLLFNKK